MDFNKFLEYLHLAFSPEQWNAINSGITSLNRQLFENYGVTKQGRLNDNQLEVLQSGITADILNSILSFNFLQTLEGYDSSKIQTLKNYNGTFKWVSDMEGE